MWGGGGLLGKLVVMMMVVCDRLGAGVMLCVDLWTLFYSTVWDLRYWEAGFFLPLCRPWQAPQSPL